MAPPKPQPKPAPPVDRAKRDRFLPAVITGAVIGLVSLPAALAAGASWVGWSDPVAGDAEAPSWLPTETVRATNGKGEMVKAKVALDAPDSDTRALIRSRPQQVSLVMQISVAEHDEAGAEGAERVQKLSANIETRLNEYLAAHKVPPVRDVVIQDLVISKP